MNKNCLEGKRCPKCGQEDEILILTPMWVSLKDDGTDPFADSLKMLGDVDYGHATVARCPVCQYEGVMSDFEVSPKNIRCYDNGGKTMDQYCVVYMDQPEGNGFQSVCMNSAPFHPQGIGMHGIAKPGRHLGKRIKFSDLPKDCRVLVRQDLDIK
jgi:hypothetical protein